MKSYEKEFEQKTGKEALIAVIGHGEKAYATWEYQQYLEKRIKDLEDRLETKDTQLPSLKEMEDEIVEALENLDIIVHGDTPMIGNKFATASVIYKVFENKT